MFAVLDLSDPGYHLCLGDRDVSWISRGGKKAVTSSKKNQKPKVWPAEKKVQEKTKSSLGEDWQVVSVNSNNVDATALVKGHERPETLR